MPNIDVLRNFDYISLFNSNNIEVLRCLISLFINLPESINEFADRFVPIIFNNFSNDMPEVKISNYLLPYYITKFMPDFIFTLFSFIHITEEKMSDWKDWGAVEFTRILNHREGLLEYEFKLEWADGSTT